MAEQPLLSIIITSYTIERMNDIYELLNSIRAQTFHNIEVVFVAERSAELFERVKSAAKEQGIPYIVVFNDSESGLSAARNIGIKQARGDILAFVDDDTLLFFDWAEEMVKTYEDDSVIGTTGLALPLWEDESLSWFPRELYWIIGCTAWYSSLEIKGIIPVRNVWGMNMSFRREAFALAGTFSSNIGGIQGRRLHGEEDDLSLRVKRRTGKRIVYNPKVKVQHKTYKRRLSTKSIVRNSYWIGYTRPMLKRIYPKSKTDTDLLSTEYQLLKRILTKLFPNTLMSVFMNPIIAWRKFYVTMIALSSVAFGYISYLSQNLLGHQKTKVHKGEA